MAGKNERIPDESTPWNGYKGSRIEEYIKDSLQNVKELAQDAATSKGIRSVHFDPSTNTLYFFDSDNDKQDFLNGDTSKVVMSQKMEFSGMVQQLKITNLSGSNTMYFTTTQEEDIISCTFVTQEKSVTDTTWNTIDEDYRVTVAVDRGSTGSYSTIVSGKTVLSGATFSVDVKQYLNSGANRVRIMAEGTTSGQVSTIVITANLTSLYLAPSNFAWNLPFKQGVAYSLGGMYIGGNLDKTIHVRVKNDTLGYDQTFEANVGTRAYTSSAYFFNGLTFPSTGTGVYNVDIWVTAGSLETDHLNYNIMCVASSDISSAKLVAINEIGDNISNYTESTIFQYCVYNGTSSSGSPTFNFSYTINGVKTNLPSDTRSNVTTQDKQSYAANIEVETEAEVFTYEASATFGNTNTVSFEVDNTSAYPATRGASFYLAPSTRSNSQGNREYIINQMDTSKTYKGTWTKMAWSDTSDGWIYDDQKRRCLYIPAHSKLDISGVDSTGAKLQPLATSVSKGRTIEFTFKCKNVSDYNDNIITIAQNPTSGDFYGIRIRPTSVVFHTHTQGTSQYDTQQDAPLKEGEPVHVVISIVKDYKTSLGNFVFIFVNGVRVRMFDFKSTDSTVAESDIIIGGNSTDVYLYNMRVYETAFGNYDAFTNYVASLSSNIEKATLVAIEDAIMDDSHESLEYTKVNMAGYNTMVIEMVDGKLPMYGNSTKPKANVEFNMPKIKRRFKLMNAVTEGQGTTSMEYYRWNLRWRIDKMDDTKKCNISEWNYTISSWGTPVAQKNVRFDNDDSHPAVKRITAKINFASSMQSHKIGATGAYNDLHEACCTTPALGRVAVFQYPFLAFEKVLVEGSTNMYTYNFIGLFTIGADKGDKPTFGFDKTEVTQLVAVEGTDHSEVLVPFNYPWDSRLIVGYNAKGNPCLGTPVGASYSYGWELTQTHDLETNEDKNPNFRSQALALFTDEFKEAYDVVYRNSGRILGVTDSISSINSTSETVSDFRKRKSADGHAITIYNIWVDGEYILYYYDQQQSKYLTTGFDLKELLSTSEKSALSSMTLEAKNNLFISKRLAKFRNEVGNSWDVNDVLFSLQFLEMFGATDNYGKNMYPYKTKPFTSGGKWRLFQDDLDTIFDIDNQGRSIKKYSIENHDFSDATQVARVFNPEGSAFLYNFTEAFKTEYEAMGKLILQKMDALASKGTNTLDRLVQFVDDYFWGNAQRYFSKMSYNKDLEYKYEEALASPTYGKGSLALEQSLGDHFLAEREWVEKRMIYLMSRYSYGCFALYSDTSLGMISWRSQVSVQLTLTPAMDLYPAIFVGQGAPTPYGSRVLDGNSVVMRGEATDNTSFYLPAANYYRSIGSLKDLVVDPTASPHLDIKAERLEEVIVGNVNKNLISTNLRGLDLVCPSLEVIDGRNVESFIDEMNLEKCPRLLKVLLSGSKVSGVTFMDGAKVTQVSLPNTIINLRMSNMAFLDTFSMDGYDSLESIFIVGCPKFTGAMTVLRGAYNTTDSKLRYIRITDLNAQGCTSSDIDMLMNLAKGLDKDGKTHKYNGMNAKGESDTSSLPIIEGHMYLTESAYQDAIDAIQPYFPQLTIHQSGNASIRFQDSNTEAVCVTNWDTNKDGKLSMVEAAAVTTVYQMFPSYSSTPHLCSFNEFQYFTGVTELKYRTFYGQEDLTSIKIPDSIVTIYNEVFEYCKGLTTITLPKVTTIGNNSFIYCTGLKSAYLPECTKFDGYSIFMGCTSLATISIPKLASIGERCFESCSSLTSINVSLLTTIPSRTFLGCSKLVVATLGANVTSISDNAFNSCSVLKSIGLTTFPLLESIGSQAFWETALEGSLNCVKCTSVGARCFEDTKLTSVNFPKVTSIQWRVLYNVGTLTSATFTSATAIGDSAFTYCKNLETLNLTPSIITIIESNAFCECNSLNGEYNFTSCSSVGYGAFMGSKSTNLSVSFPSLSTLGERAFEGTVLTSIASLGNIENIPSRCFFESLIETLTIPSTVTTIGDHSFDGCTKLANLTFANSKNIISLGYASFQNVPFSGTLDFSNVESVGGFCFHEAGSSDGFSVTGFALGCEINARAFWDSKVKVIDLKNCTIIKENAFNGCKQLESIGLLTNVVSIEGYAFYGAGFKGGNIILHAPNLASLDGSAFRDSLSLKKITNLGKITTLPDNGVWGVFRSCKNLESVVFPNGLTSIAQLSFYECSSLSDISWNNVIRLENEAFAFALTKKEYTIPITSMHGYGVFRGCYATSLIFPNLVSIDETTSVYGAMNDCKQLTKVFIGESFTSSGNSVFRGCSALKLLICKATTPPQLGAECFSGTHANLTIFVPLASVSAYQGADVWSGVSGKIVGYTEVTTLPSTPDTSLYYLVGTDIFKYDTDSAMWLKYNPTTGYFSVDVVFYDRLVGDGTAKMDLGVAYSTNTIVTFDFVNSGNVGAKNITWVYKAYSNKTFISIITNDNTSVRVGIGASGNSYSGLACGAKVNALHRFAISMDLKNREAWVGNGTHVSVPRDDSSTGDPDGINWNLAAAAISIYEVKITDLDGNLLHDFKPAMMGSLVGMFDEVESKFVSQSNTEGAYTVANDD